MITFWHEFENCVLRINMWVVEKRQTRRLGAANWKEKDKSLYSSVSVFSANRGTPSILNWNLEVLVFEEMGKPENQDNNLSEQGQEPTTNRKSNPGNVDGRRVLSPLRHPCSLK